MSIMFSENYDKLAKFVFSFYDFDKDGLVSKEDIRTVLSYVSINSTSQSASKYKFDKYV